MKIGKIGVGNMGSGLGKIWAERGQKLMFSFADDPQKLEELAKSVGDNASRRSPADAAGFGEVVLLTVPWGAIEEDIRKTEGKLGDRVVISCNNPLKPDLSGLAIGTTTS
jgi:8-hydroxy-5-deazaflavin:NADPH oxidoreductase